MLNKTNTGNPLFYSDNLPILREHIADEQEPIGITFYTPTTR
jgi:hypothetical protein